MVVSVVAILVFISDLMKPYIMQNFKVAFDFSLKLVAYRDKYNGTSQINLTVSMAVRVQSFSL